jgi:hypothetical protein
LIALLVLSRTSPGASEPEIEQDWAVPSGHQNIRRFEIAMANAPPMEIIQGLG